MIVDLFRPICEVDGCTKTCAKRYDGTDKYRRKCWKHQSVWNKEAHNQRVKRWQSKNREKVNMAAREWSKSNPEKAKMRNRKSNLKRKSGITLDIYEEHYRKQDGKCAICNKYYDKLCADHCHMSGKFRGLLCSQCNIGLGMFKDSVDCLNKAKEYLCNSH
jgi:hypothetical protein